MPPITRLENLSFDLYTRYRGLSSYLATLGIDRPRVLDAGGATPVFWEGFASMIRAILPGAPLAVSLDLLDGRGLSDYARASGLALPFRDREFDVVCAMDALEHVPPASRSQFIRELLRVSSGLVYLTFPVRSEATERAENTIRVFARDVLQSPVPQLSEHEEYGLPERQPIEDLLASSGVASAWTQQGNLDVWVAMMMAYHALRVQNGEELVHELNYRFNTTAAVHDWAEPGYRWCLAISRRHSAHELHRAFEQIRGRSSADILRRVENLCQMVLQIAQNGRMISDRDRHIRNLEAQIVHLQTERANWLPAQLFELQKQLQENVVLQKQLQEHVESQKQHAERQAQTQSDFVRRIEQMEKQQAEYSAGLARSIEVQKAALQSLQAKVAQQDARVDRTQREVLSILNSRIWKTLVKAAGLVVRASGAPTPATPPAAAPPPEPPVAEAGLQLAWEDPPPDNKARSGVVTVRGWALGENPVDRITVAAGGTETEARLGVLRPDVGRAFPQATNATRSGYIAEVDTSAMPSGTHVFQLRFYSGGTLRRELSREVLIDHERAFRSDYDRWIAQFEQRDADLIRMRAGGLEYAPLLSIIMPVFRPDPGVLRDAIESVLRQSYATWELCIADDCSQVQAIEEMLRGYASRDPRIKVVFRETRGGISNASNSALELAAGEFCGLLDHDDELAEDALFHVVEALQSDREAGIVYSDEDKIDAQGRRREPFFKPDWSPDLLLSENYICHFLVFRRSLLDSAGLFRPECDGSQDYDLLLRLRRQAPRILHVPRVLYHWRSIPQSTADSIEAKPYAINAARKAVEDDVRSSVPGGRVEPGVRAGRWRVRYPLTERPGAAIIIASGGKLDVLRTNIDSQRRTSYPNREYVIADNSKGEQIKSYCTAEKLRWLDMRGLPFNYSAINNRAARECDAPLLVFLNDDTSVIEPGWLEAMAELAMRRDAGAVGAKLLYPDGRIQHAGVVMGMYDNCGHAFKGLDASLPHYFDFPDVIRNISAVTGACLAVRSLVFWEAGGFDEEKFAVAFNDIDLCLKIAALGYKNLYTPHALLYHHEAFSKTAKDLVPHPDEVRQMQIKWRNVIEHDPYYSPNLSRSAEDYSLRELAE